MTYKERQKALQQPDELQKLGRQALPWLETHGKLLVSIIVGLIAVGLVVAIVTSWKQGREEQAFHDFNAVLRILDEAFQGDAQEEELEAKNGESLAEEEEEEAAEKDEALAEAQRSEALIGALIKFRQDHVSRKASTHAALLLAQALIQQGKYDEALPMLNEYMRESDLNNPLRTAAHEAHGYALESLQKYDEAIVAFETMTKETNSEFMQGMGLYHRARMLLLKGDTDGGVKQLSEIQAAAPQSAAARLAQERLQLLSAQGVVVAAQALEKGSET